MSAHSGRNDGAAGDETWRLTTLESGIRVISESMPRVETAAVGAWVDVGTRHEPAELNGVAHLLEHMAFKGTATRSAREIAETIEAVGGSLNAYTSREHTAYYARIMADDLPLAVELIGDILQHSALDEGELEKERQVVLQEIGQVQDTPDDLVFDLVQETAFPDQPMGRSILGPEDLVASMPRQALFDYMRDNYTPERIILAAAGKVDHEQIVILAQKFLAELPQTLARSALEAKWKGGILVDQRPDLEQIHWCVGLETFDYLDPDYYALQVFSAALGGGMSSRLFQEAREKRGLCYTVSTFASSFADSGLMGVYAGTGTEELGQLVEVVRAQTIDLAEKPLAVEIARARAQLKASLFMALESCSALCEASASQLLCLKRRVAPSELLDEIDAVNEAAIRRVGDRLLAAARPAVAMIGPTGDPPELLF